MFSEVMDYNRPQISYPTAVEPQGLPQVTWNVLWPIASGRKQMISRLQVKSCRPLERSIRGRVQGLFGFDGSAVKVIARKPSFA